MKTIKRCVYCKGTNVFVDAWANANDISDVRTFDATFCEDCGGQTTLIDHAPRQTDWLSTDNAKRIVREEALLWLEAFAKDVDTDPDVDPETAEADGMRWLAGLDDDSEDFTAVAEDFALSLSEAVANVLMETLFKHWDGRS